MKKGLVMEGGAMRGMFTCGVLDVLMENDIDFDAAVGVSAGATFGCNIKSRQIGRALRYNCKYCTDSRYHSFRSLMTSGDLYNAEFCYHELPYKLDMWDVETFKNNPMEFYCVVTDLNTGGPVYHKCYDGMEGDIDWIQASASMPIVSRIVNIDGGAYLDGGTGDSIPIEFMENKGCDRILVIETQPLDYVKSKQKFMSLMKLKYHKYPKYLEASENRYMRYNKQKRYIRQREDLGKVFVIRPKAPLNISPIEKDAKELKRVYELGREAAIERLQELKDYLK